jgi:hypothetical protein
MARTDRLAPGDMRVTRPAQQGAFSFQFFFHES